MKLNLTFLIALVLCPAFPLTEPFDINLFIGYGKIHLDMRLNQVVSHAEEAYHILPIFSIKKLVLHVYCEM